MIIIRYLSLNNSVELDVFNGVAESAAAAVADCRHALDFNHAHFGNKRLSIAPKRTILPLRKNTCIHDERAES